MQTVEAYEPSGLVPMFGDFPPVAGIAAISEPNFAASNVTVGHTVPYTAIEANDDLIGSLSGPKLAMSKLNSPGLHRAGSKFRWTDSVVLIRKV